VARGGARPGAGRKAGSLNKRTSDIAEALSEGLTPLEFLTNIYRDVKEDMARRVDAAKAAAPYVHPRRAPINSDGEDAAGITVVIQKP
jgi:hypothetical protein